MALGFGVGDIIALTTLLVNTIEDIVEAPKELQDVAERVLLIEETLESIDKELSQNAIEGTTNSIVRRKERVKEVLTKMRAIVMKYRDTQGRIKPFKRVL